MRQLIQLDPAIWLVTPLGEGRAIIYETDEDDWYWLTILDNGAIVKFRNDQIKAGNSYTLGRGIDNTTMKVIVNDI